MTAPRDDGSWPPPSGGQPDQDATWLAPTPQPPTYPSGPPGYPPSPGGGYPPPGPPSYGAPGQQPYGSPAPDYPAPNYPAPDYPAPDYPAAPYPAAPPPPPSYPGAGYPQYPGQGPASNPYYSAPASGNNGMAVASLATSIAGVVIGIPLSLFCFIGFVIPVVGLVLGIIALNQIKQSQQPGRGMALAGIWVSAVTLGLLAIFFVIGVAVFAAGSH